ncbi:MAG TPA: RcpC/CpaB family pilus assembly protein, partial [Sphingobium sp.]
TDQRMDALGADGKPVVQTYSNVTIEVTPKIAEKIAVAQTIGSLSLSLRSLADNASDLDAAIAGADVDLPDSANPNAEKKIIAKLAARPVDKGTTYSTGADVSRYQRSSVPAKPLQTASVGAVPGMGAPAGGGSVNGPVIRVARGTNVTVVPVGGK